jgi:hypothetical protein
MKFGSYFENKLSKNFTAETETHKNPLPWMMHKPEVPVPLSSASGPRREATYPSEAAASKMCTRKSESFMPEKKPLSFGLMYLFMKGLCRHVGV